MIPSRAFDLPLSHYEFRLLAVLCRLTGQEGTVEARIAELGILTQGASEKTVRRALRALEGHGLISRRRLRSAGGYLDRYEYTVISLPVTHDHLVESLPVTHDRTELSIGSKTGSTSNTSNTSSHLYQVSKSTMGNTTYFLAPEGSEEEKPMKYIEDGEDIGGFGLTEPKPLSQQRVNKRDPKTRRKRPQHEWTTMDVAAEFSRLVGDRYPWLPGTLNMTRLSGALAKYRTQYRTTPLIELELLRLFMADEKNFQNVGGEEPHLYKKYLASFRTKMNQARENLGLPISGLSDMSEPTPEIEHLVASDGKTFPNTMSGRVLLETYEKRLAR